MPGSARAHVRIAGELQAARRRAIVLSGGELTVTIRGKGQGGPNQEYALAAAQALEGISGITVLAADTDGTDGGGGSADSPAGALADGETAIKARALGLDPAHFLAENDFDRVFLAAGGLLTPGPTYTNVNDFRAILSIPHETVVAERHHRGARWCAARSRRLRCWPPQDRPRRIFVCATIPAAASASRSATRKGRPGPPKAGNLSSRTCETLLRGTLSSRFYYIYAVDYDRVESGRERR